MEMHVIDVGSLTRQARGVEVINLAGWLIKNIEAIEPYRQPVAEFIADACGNVVV